MTDGVDDDALQVVKMYEWIEKLKHNFFQKKNPRDLFL